MGQLQRSAFSGRSLAPCLPRYWTRSRYHLPPSVRLGEPWGRLKGHRVAGAVIKADIRMHIALHRPIATGRVGIEPTTGSHRDAGRLLHRLHGEIFGRLDDDRPLATDPGDHGRPIFVIMAPARLALLTATTCPASQQLLPA